jgi:hypothetical protein
MSKLRDTEITTVKKVVAQPREERSEARTDVKRVGK